MKEGRKKNHTLFFTSFHKMFLSIEDTRCPLRFASYIGDCCTVKILLASGEWDRKILCKSLELASAFGHVRCVGILVLFYPEVSEAVAHACIQNRCSVLEVLLKRCDSLDDFKTTGLQWAVHMDHIEVLMRVHRRFPRACSDYTLGVALASKSPRCLDFVLHNMHGPVSADTLRCAMENDPDMLPRLFATRWGARPGADFWSDLKQRDAHLFRWCMKLQAKRRWRQVRAIGRIQSFWRNWVMDYYSPGNRSVQRGKGFEQAAERWRRQVDA